jgi:proteasome activator subunit 4
LNNQNDPIKTVCATMFITAVVQAGVKIGDSSNQVGLSLGSDAPGEEMIIDDGLIGVPEGAEPGMSILNREEERSLARDSTAGFAGNFSFCRAYEPE